MTSPRSHESGGASGCSTGAPHGVVEMRKRAFDPFAALAHQAAAASSPHPATIAIHRRLGLGILRPITSPPVRLGHVGPDAPGGQVDQGLIAVIPLITDDLVQRPDVNVGLRVFDLLGRGDGGLDDRRVSPTSAPCSVTATIAPVSMSTACSALCARCVRPSFIFDLRIGIVGVRPQVFFFRFRSRARPARVGVSIPEAVARPARNAWCSRRCPGGRCCASPRSPRASWRQSRWSYPSAGRPRRGVVAPT